LPESCITKEARQELNKLWLNEHFRCVEEEIVERLLTTRTGYQVRSIPLIVNASVNGEELGYQEAVINFNKFGVITSFYYTINPELYSKLRMNQMSDKRFEVTDIRDRMMILDYVEHFRTSYNQKDIKFLRQVFSDDALIITGKVITEKPNSDMDRLTLRNNKVVYIKQTKQEYIQKLNSIFKMNKFINVKFEDIDVVQHPKYDDIYGVTLKQYWHTSHYSDEGYLFLMIDFRDANNPLIQVRTWQPYKNNVGQVITKKEDVYHLGSFRIVR
jgi:hypothetical protein